MNITQQKMKEWVELYLKHVREITVEAHVQREEGYKFHAVETFQRHFNLEASNLAGMLDEAIENNNLVLGAQYYPKKVLLVLAEKYPEDVRIVLKDLFDVSVDVNERITSVKVALEKINERRITEGEKGVHTYIGLRFLSLILGYRYPNEANALKPSEWKVFCRFFDSDFKIPQHTSAGEQYRMYSEYIEPLREYLKSLPEIAEIKAKLTEGLSFKDDEYRWMTQDVIYVTARVLAGERSEEAIPVALEMSSEQGAENSRDDNDGDGVTGLMPLEEYLEEYIVRNWDTINFGEALQLYVDEDGSPAQQYTTDVGVIDILAKDAGGNFVVIELKRAESGYKVVGQVLNYMGWVMAKLAQDGQRVRGLIIVGRADKTLRAALRPVEEKISALEYRVSLNLSRPKDE